MRSVRSQPWCDVVALHDPDAAALARLGDATGIDTRATEFEALLATGVDFVVLAGPCGDRLPQVEAAAQQGVHCCLHAPMAPDAATAAAMVSACDSSGVKLGVVVRPQADPALDQVRRMIADDWLGAPVLVASVVGDDRSLRSPPPAGHWSRDYERAGDGTLLQLGTEHLHLAIWLTERAPQRAVAMATQGFSAMPQDSAGCVLVLRGGIVCSFVASHLCRGNGLAIQGTDGSVMMAPDRLRLRGRRAYGGEAFDYPVPDQELVLPTAAAALDPVTSGRHELHGRFARWIDDCDDFPCPGDQAAADLRAIDAIRRAIASGSSETV